MGSKSTRDDSKFPKVYSLNRLMLEQIWNKCDIIISWCFSYNLFDVTCIASSILNHSGSEWLSCEINLRFNWDFLWVETLKKK